MWGEPDLIKITLSVIVNFRYSVLNSNQNKTKTHFLNSNKINSYEQQRKNTHYLNEYKAIKWRILEEAFELFEINKEEFQKYILTE